MRSIRRRFEKMRRKHEELGDYIIFARAIRGQKFTKDMIMRWFGKLVEKDDYDRKDKKSLARQLKEISEAVVDTFKREQNRSPRD